MSRFVVRGAGDETARSERDEADRLALRQLPEGKPRTGLLSAREAWFGFDVLCGIRARHWSTASSVRIRRLLARDRDDALARSVELIEPQASAEQDQRGQEPTSASATRVTTPASTSMFV